MYTRKEQEMIEAELEGELEYNKYDTEQKRQMMREMIISKRL